MSKISIIIPVYNVEKYLRECLDSVINQTLTDIEIICINDGSTDKSLEILNEYKNKDSRIVVINKENSGAGDSRNKGLEIAKGEYIHFLDSDDFIKVNIYEKLYNQIHSNNADICLFKFEIYSEKTRQITSANWCLQTNKIVTDKDGIIYIDQDNLYQVTAPNVFTKLYKREFIKKHNLTFQNTKVANDIYFNMCSLAFAEKITYIDEAFILLRRDISTNLTSNRGKHPFCILEALTAVKNQLSLMNKFESLKTTFYQRAVDCFNYELNFSNNIKKYHLKKLYKDFLPREFQKQIKSRNLLSSFSKQIFSIENSLDKRHKMISLLGIKCKIKKGKCDA